MGDDALPAPPPEQPRRGRPLGSISLTPEIEQTIVSYVRAGAFDYVAAEAAGVPARTFHEWIQRGEDRHPTRVSTPELRAFADAVRTAHAEARVAAEVRIYKENPKWWLSHAARSRRDAEGWTNLREQPENEERMDQRVAELIRRLDAEESVQRARSGHLVDPYDDLPAQRD